MFARFGNPNLHTFSNEQSITNPFSCQTYDIHESVCPGVVRHFSENCMAKLDEFTIVNVTISLRLTVLRNHALAR